MSSHEKKFTVIDGGLESEPTPSNPPLRRKERRRDALPANLPPAGLRREEAAAYVGVSATIFDRMVADGLMPKGFLIYACRVWNRRKLDIAFEKLDTEDASSDIQSKMTL